MSQTKFSPSGDTVWTPLHIQLLFHYHTTYSPVTPWADSQRRYTRHLLNAGLIAVDPQACFSGHYTGSGYETTPKGGELVQRLCNTPLEKPTLPENITLVMPKLSEYEHARAYQAQLNRLMEDGAMLQHSCRAGRNEISRLKDELRDYRQHLDVKNGDVLRTQAENFSLRQQLKQFEEHAAFLQRNSCALAQERDQLKTAIAGAKRELEQSAPRVMACEAVPVHAPETGKPNLKFPRLLVYGFPGNRQIVFATGEQGGFVIESNNPYPRKIGHEYGAHSGYWNNSAYDVYKGEYPKLLSTNGRPHEVYAIATSDHEGWFVTKGKPEFDNFQSAPAKWERDCGLIPYTPAP